MLRKIIVPIDGSELSDRILHQVRRLLLRNDARVILVRVLDPSSADLDDERTSASLHLDRLRDALVRDGAQAERRVLEGDPAAKVLELAREERPDVIALATHGRTGIARWIRGSVAERIVRGSEFPILAVNPLATGSKKRFGKILVALDGSDASASVLPLVGDLAKLYESEVILFHAVETLVGDFTGDAFAVESWNEGIAYLEAQRAKLAGVNARTKIVAGTAAEAILDAADAEDADLVVLTTHGRSGASRWIFGSVAEQVIRHCGAPLLVKRTAAVEEAALVGRAGQRPAPTTA